MTEVMISEPIENTNPVTQNIGRISFGVLLIISLIIITTLLRLISLGSVPITGSEIERGLSAYRGTFATESGTLSVSDTPVQFWLQRIALLIFGRDEFALRFFTAVAGILLCFVPLWFVRLIGLPRALILCVLLIISPTMIASARLSSGAVWSMLFAGGMLFSLWHYWEERKPTAGMLLVVFASLLVLMSEPGGLILFLILIAALLIALTLTIIDSPDYQQVSSSALLGEIQNRFTGFPWVNGLLIAVLLIMVLSTGFLIQPSGLRMVGAVLEGFVTGFGTASQGSPFLYPLLVSIFYDLGYWILAALALILMIRLGEVTFVERFLLAWVLIGVIASVLFRGAEAVHGIWLVVPLAGLASFALKDAFQQDDEPVLWMGQLVDEFSEEYASWRWGKWVLALLMFALLILATVHLQIVTRGLLNVPNGSLTQFMDRLGEPAFNNVAQSLIWLAIALLFISVGYFLAASIWGGQATLRGALIGTFGFLAMYGVSTGWNIAVENVDNPVELWYTEAVHPDSYLLRETLYDLAARESGGFPAIPVIVVGEDGTLISWLLRDFENVRYVQSVQEAFTEPIVIVNSAQTDLGLGGSYVGQQFNLTMTWSLGSMQGFDFLPWWSVRRSRVTSLNGFSTDAIILWVRQDYYDSNPIELPGSNFG